MMPTPSDHPLDRWQFRLSAVETKGAQPVGKFWLTLGEGLPLTQVQDKHGTALGVILGFAIDISASEMLSDTWIAPSNTNHDDFARDVLWQLGGRYLWISTSGNTPRIYPDAGTQLTCVYDPILKCAGAVAGAILNDAEYVARFNSALFDDLGIDGEGWFPAGLTAHEGLNRLLPNHYLDLNSWEMHRLPLSFISPRRSNTDEIVDRMIAILQSQIKALAASGQTPAFALTAGYETRVLLACGRDFLNDITFVTVVGEDRHQIDSTIARRIATDLSLEHIELPRQTANLDQQALFLRRGGHCNGDSNVKYHPSVWPLLPDHVFVGGLGGEIGRAFLWRDGDTAETPINPAMLTKRFGLPSNAALQARLGDWLKTLESQNGSDAFDLLDLAYIENRMGPWSSVQFCSDPTVVRHAPMFTYETAELMRSLPSDWKRSSQLGKAIIAKAWPELAKYPYNSLGLWRDTWVKIQRVIANPSMVTKKLRQFGR